MYKRYLIIFALLITLPFIGKFYWAKQETEVLKILPCADITRGCGNDFLDVHFEESPKVMQPLHLNLHLRDAENIKNIHIDFVMKNMEMGLNRYLLIPSNQRGEWQAVVTLPVCSQGRSHWNMMIEIESADIVQHFQIPFSANPSGADLQSS